MKIRPGLKLDAKTDRQLLVYKDDRMLGFFDGFFLHPERKRLWFIDQANWVDGTSPREKLEVGVWLTRQDVHLWWVSLKKDFKFYKTIAKYGNLRKVGVSHAVRDDGSTMLWETVGKK